MFYMSKLFYRDGYSIRGRGKILAYGAVLCCPTLWTCFFQSDPRVYRNVHLERKHVHACSYKSANDSFIIVSFSIPQAQKNEMAKIQRRTSWADFVSHIEKIFRCLCNQRSVILGLHVRARLHDEWNYYDEQLVAVFFVSQGLEPKGSCCPLQHIQNSFCTAKVSRNHCSSDIRHTNLS